MKKLSERQRLFCKYVCEGINPSVAAIKAGYSRKGSSSQACRLLKSDRIQKEIYRLEKEMASPNIMGLRERKEYLSRIVRAKITDYLEVVDGNIQLKTLEGNVPDDVLVKYEHATRTYKNGKVMTRTTVKLANKIKAIHELNKLDGIYRKRSRNNRTYR